MGRAQVLQAIENALLLRYGSLDAPDFRFVGPALRKSPLKKISGEIEALGARVTEDTDPNTDVALGYVIEGADEQLFVQISVVGPFSQLRRVHGDGSIELIESANDCRSELERRICELLRKHGLELLDRETLLSPLPMELPNTPCAEATVHNALFSDDEPGL